jgi:uncharacterized membrane protein YkoI
MIAFCNIANAQHGKSQHAKISAAQANAVALKKYPGKIVGKTPLENEEGTWQYGVLVQSGKTLREVMVNANTGKIDSVEVTTKQKEAKEKAADEANAKKTVKTHK